MNLPRLTRNDKVKDVIANGVKHSHKKKSIFLYVIATLRSQ